MSEYVCHGVSSPLDAVVHLPGSKSITNRALVVAALADGHSILSNALLAEDTWLMVEALRALGISMTVDENERLIEVTGCGGHIPESEAQLFCGNSGTTIRFCTALAALGQGRFELDGIARMRQRPIGGLVTALQSLGAAVEYLGQEGYPPLVVHARGLRSGEAFFDSPQSSQMVSALLLVAPCARGDVLIEIGGHMPSAPYLRTTAAVMERFGVSVLSRLPDPSRDHREPRTSVRADSRMPDPSRDRQGAVASDAPADAANAIRFIIEAPQRYRGATYSIEPDASNATYFLAAPAVAGGRVTVDALGTQSIQGDARFVDVLEAMGCRVVCEPSRLTVHAPADGRLRGIDVDLNDMPDTVPTLAVLSVFADGPTSIRNVASLRVKETDRIAALACELQKLGATIQEAPDGLTIVPPGPRASDPPATSPPLIDTYNDHRMAMSFALAGLRIAGLRINEPECVAKTFPEFLPTFERMLAPAD